MERLRSPRRTRKPFPGPKMANGTAGTPASGCTTPQCMTSRRRGRTASRWAPGERTGTAGSAAATAPPRLVRSRRRPSTLKPPLPPRHCQPARPSRVESWLQGFKPHHASGNDAVNGITCNTTAVRGLLLARPCTPAAPPPDASCPASTCAAHDAAVKPSCRKSSTPNTR